MTRDVKMQCRDSNQHYRRHKEEQPQDTAKLTQLSYKKVRLKSVQPLNAVECIIQCRRRLPPRSPPITSMKYLIILIAILLHLCVKCVLCNRPPRFIIEGHSEIVLRLKEGPDTPVGSIIYRLKGVDPDDDVLTFGLRDSVSSDLLRIENVGTNEANIILEKELDRELKDEYSFVLTLTDHNLGFGNFVTQSLLLLVEDVNDNEPVFKPYQSALEVAENSRPGVLTTLEATDLDEGAYGQVVYYLQELDGDNDMFSITTQQGKGVIRLVRELDYERKSLYQLRVLAVDRANQGKINTGTAAVLIKVKDVEDQPPEFTSVQPVARIAENVPVGYKVLQVKAADGDRGVNNKISYKLVKGGSGLFKIDENTGVVQTIRELDREDPENDANGAYILEIIAVERSKIEPQPSVRTEVTIILQDINDETPTFGSTEYYAEIKENAQDSTPVQFIGNARNIVADYDQGNNGTFDLFIEPDIDIFDITPRRVANEATFLVRVKNSKLLDYEQIKSVNFSLVAMEIVPNGRSSIVPMTINILDANDNFPEFTESYYEFSVPENIGVGATVGNVQAYDDDSEMFGTDGIRYTSIGGSIAHLLSLNPMSGIITVKSHSNTAFDRELVSTHYLTIEARDDLGNGNRNTVQMVINITDVNDNAPVFLQRKYEARLLENSISFETPLIVEARDADLNGTKNSEIHYDIVDGELKANFTIDSKSGTIRPVNVIDFEELHGMNEDSNIRAINLIVRARDYGTPRLSARVPVIIYVQDVNDFGPIFQKGFYSAKIPENLPGGTTILKVKAFDEDGSSPNNLVVYRIQKGAGDKFVIGSDSGIISVALGASLDPDQTDPKTVNYTLVVLGLDSGVGDQQLASLTTVNITILDVNNKSPTFSDPGTVIVQENVAVGTIVHRLIANDLDSDAALRYKLDANSSEARSDIGALVKTSEYDYLSAFEINPTDGMIKVIKLIDRERVEQIKLGFTVEDIAATTSPQIASAHLMIMIDDVNDNNPKFRKPFYKRSITENSPNGVLIVNVVAYDVDKNRTIQYSLEGPPNITKLVHLDTESGEIVVANKIDHEINSWLNLTVRATDSGIPPRSSLIDVFVQVVDENDNNPYFVGERFNFSVPENTAVGTRITTIQANDADSGDFGKITFLMDRMSSHGLFTINADTGVLSVAGNLDRETKMNYMLVVEAWDNYQFGYLSGESRNAFKQIYIKVTDVNDSPPILRMPKGCVQITEYHDLRELVAVIKAEDNDDPLSPNGKVSFSLGTSGNDLFQIIQKDDWTAEVYTQQSLQNLFGNYTLQIQANDLGEPQNHVEQDLHVCVLDFNDHPPIFTMPTQNTTIRIPENATIGMKVIQVMATDQDSGENAAVRYRFKHDMMGNYHTFSIDQDSGVITLNKLLDREKQKIYELRIEAYDQGIPTPLTTELDITVYVRNVNDYEPQFLVDEIAVNFTEHTKPMTEKIKLPDTVDRDEVDDLDDPPSLVCYFIVNGNDNGIFKLDAETHILMVLKELDREVKANHTLVIKATEDCQHPPSDLPQLNPLALTRSVESEAPPKYRIGSYKNGYDRYKHSRSIRSAPHAAAATIISSISDEDDGTLVRIVVHVQDINDNPPVFLTKVFTGGVTTEADFGSQFMQIKAIDRDSGKNAVVNYYQIGEIQKTLAEGLDSVQGSPFLVDIKTGAVKLNFDPQKGMKGYFDFMVMANDTGGLMDTAHVFIYLLREDQRVRFVLRQQPPEIRDQIETFREILSNVTDAIVNVDEFKIHENRDGSVDKTKTDLYMHLVDKKDNSILEVADVLKLVDTNIDRLDKLFKDFNVLDTQPAEALLLTGDLSNRPMFVWLAFANIFVTCFLIIILVLCISQRASFKRQLRAARVNAYGPPLSDIATRSATARVPNTNKHSVEGSNPIWLKAYENEWYKNDEELSHSESHQGSDSLDENVLSGDDFIKANYNAIERQNDFDCPYNVYQQVDRMANSAKMLTRKLETTEL